MAWKGNPSNPVPNEVQESIARSEKRVDANRSFPVRRDTDKQKDNTITFMDVDKVILDHLEKMQISVTDEGGVVNVPIFYGSPEKWVAARRDGFIRDRQGKIQLPAMIFRRTASGNDDNIEIFNRYVKYPVVQKHSVKNQYTQFAILAGKNAPVHEVYNISMADHMIFTYSFIVWTEYHEQMNPIIEKIKFNTKDYWGSPRGFRFRCKVDSDFTHTTELNSDDDRVVKTEFTLITNGYILPESYQLLDRQYPTTDKLFTPKKIIIGMETVSTDYDMSQLETTPAWKSQKYPNLDRGQEPTGPGITWGDSSNSSTLSPDVASLVSSLRVSTTSAGFTVTTQQPSGIVWQSVPSYADSPGSFGWMAYDRSYLYVYAGGSWKRIPINQLPS